MTASAGTSLLLGESLRKTHSSYDVLLGDIGVRIRRYYITNAPYAVMPDSSWKMISGPNRYFRFIQAGMKDTKVSVANQVIGSKSKTANRKLESDAIHESRISIPWFNIYQWRIFLASTEKNKNIWRSVDFLNYLSLHWTLLGCSYTLSSNLLQVSFLFRSPFWLGTIYDTTRMPQAHKSRKEYLRRRASEKE